MAATARSNRGAGVTVSPQRTGMCPYCKFGSAFGIGQIESARLFSVRVADARNSAENMLDEETRT